MYTLYVIPGSHACRTAMLMLDHKGLEYERVDILTLLHPVASRLHGFDAGGQTRSAGGRRSFGLRFGDRLGTVPGLAAGDERISTNHNIARYLDEVRPDPPLFPAEPDRRTAVEDAERWGNEELQMMARRIPASAAAHEPKKFAQFSRDGRLGPLLYKQEWARRFVVPTLGRFVFAASPKARDELLAELPPILDRIDTWIGEGVLNGPEVNAADFMIAPSLALILYRPDTRPLFEGRPALELVDRLLPEPS